MYFWASSERSFLKILRPGKTVLPRHKVWPSPKARSSRASGSSARLFISLDDTSNIIALRTMCFVTLRHAVPKRTRERRKSDKKTAAFVLDVLHTQSRLQQPCAKKSLLNFCAFSSSSGSLGPHSCIWDMSVDAFLSSSPSVGHSHAMLSLHFPFFASSTHANTTRKVTPPKRRLGLVELGKAKHVWAFGAFLTFPTTPRAKSSWCPFSRDVYFLSLRGGMLHMFAFFFFCAPQEALECPTKLCRLWARCLLFPDIIPFAVSSQYLLPTRRL